MAIVATTTAPETRADALMRLATQARATGVRLYQDRADGRFYASSRSQPGTLHRLTGFSCTCPGFVRHGRCAHLAALHCALGWINDDPTPEPPTPISTCNAISPCGECGGMGEVQDLEVRQYGRYHMQWAPCTACNGSGKRSLDHAA
jgi:hypothetical protein